MDTKTESKRVEVFRLFLAKEIPKFPNNSQTLQSLEQMHLVDLLIAFMNWRLRHVRKTVRTVNITATAADDPRWQSLSTNIEVFLQKVKKGDDLSPHLSQKVKKRGFTPRSTPTSTWEDKDFILNVMGLHHFHLGMTIEKSGSVTPTNDVLFASVSRDSFDVIGIFNHEVFDSKDPEAMTPERQQLWGIYEERQRRGALPGALIIGGFGGSGISSSGVSLAVTFRAQEYFRIIKEYELKLDDPSFVRDVIFAHNPVPKKPKFNWELNCLDLRVIEKTSNRDFLLRKGPN
jgi:hypothetical protein